jgi:hypothetical protein
MLIALLSVLLASLARSDIDRGGVVPARALEHSCLVPGCPHPGRNQLGVRCRVAHSGASPFPEKRRTDAIFSVESAGYLCDAHALEGGKLVLRFEPHDRRNVMIVATSGSGIAEPRSKEIRQPFVEAA